jgi:NAD(P)-dependent dehydrogenase (short-subunit alcohol dehydrogenase family)
LAQVMFTFDLAAELKGTGVTVTCLHPGTYMNTNMVAESGIAPVTPVEEGVDAVLRLAASPEVAGQSGPYYNGLREARADAQAYDATARRRLRDLTLQLTKLPLRG